MIVKEGNVENRIGIYNTKKKKTSWFEHPNLYPVSIIEEKDWFGIADTDSGFYLVRACIESKEEIWRTKLDKRAGVDCPTLPNRLVLGGVKAFDPKTGEEVFELEGGQASYSAGETHIITTGELTRIFEPTTGKLLKTLKLLPHQRILAVSPNCKNLVINNSKLLDAKVIYSIQ